MQKHPASCVPTTAAPARSPNVQVPVCVILFAHSCWASVRAARRAIGTFCERRIQNSARERHRSYRQEAHTGEATCDHVSVLAWFSVAGWACWLVLVVSSDRADLLDRSSRGGRERLLDRLDGGELLADRTEEGHGGERGANTGDGDSGIDEAEERRANNNFRLRK